jgi:hypothetical protein
MTSSAAVQMGLWGNGVTEGKTHALQILAELVEHVDVKGSISNVSVHLFGKGNFVSWSGAMFVMGTHA